MNARGDQYENPLMLAWQMAMLFCINIQTEDFCKIMLFYEYWANTPVGELLINPSLLSLVSFLYVLVHIRQYSECQHRVNKEIRASGTNLSYDIQL